MKICKYCNKDNEENARSCQNCGKSLESGEAYQVKNDEFLFCPECESSTSDNGKKTKSKTKISAPENMVFVKG